ncbi:hypothetical protein Tco_0790783 [Tanacetum coccineum]
MGCYKQEHNWLARLETIVLRASLAESAIDFVSSKKKVCFCVKKSEEEMAIEKRKRHGDDDEDNKRKRKKKSSPLRHLYVAKRFGRNFFLSRYSI